jgi:hypothetical protein
MFVSWFFKWNKKISFYNSKIKKLIFKMCFFFNLSLIVQFSLHILFYWIWVTLINPSVIFVSFRNYILKKIKYVCSHNSLYTF